MSKKCGECSNFDRSLSKCNKVQDESIRETDTVICCPFYELKPLTLFDQITASPEVLAEEFVEPYTRWGDDGHLETLWRSNFRELSGMLFDTKEQAITATVAKLKEVAK